jgi:hypothetical protein
VQAERKAKQKVIFVCAFKRRRLFSPQGSDSASRTKSQTKIHFLFVLLRGAAYFRRKAAIVQAERKAKQKFIFCLCF